MNDYNMLDPCQFGCLDQKRLQHQAMSARLRFGTVGSAEKDFVRAQPGNV